MDAQQFLAEFGHIANAPGGIARLRELILDLAIRGELLAEQTGVSNATSLIREIIEFRLKLVQDGKLRRPTPLPEIEESELSFKLPDSWAFERLGNICEIVRGVTFPSSKKQTFRTDDVVACLRTSNVQAEVDWSDLIFINPDLVKRDDQWIEFGDTMISMANSYELVGKVALVREVKERATFGGFIAAIRPHVIEPEYLYLVLRSPYMQSRMRVTASQTTNIANISLGGMRPIPTPIPPKEEQSRIVAKVDELMALCDQLEAQQQKRRTLQNHLRQATLQAVAASQSPHELQESWQRLEANFGQLFSVAEDVGDLRRVIWDMAIRGFLSEAMEDDIPAKTTFEKLKRAEKDLVREKLLSRPKPFPALLKTDEPFPLPENWIWVRLGELAPEFQNGLSKRQGTSGDETIVLRLADVVNFEIFINTPRKILMTTSEREKYCLHQGDLLITRVNGSAEIVGSFIKCNIENIAYCDHFIRLRFLPEYINPDYITIAAQSPFVRAQISSKFVTTAGQKTVNQNHIGALLFPIPPLQEQNRIIKKVEDLLLSCTALSEKHEKANKISELLATASVSALTGIAIDQEEEPMKAPQTEVAEMREKASS